MHTLFHVFSLILLYPRTLSAHPLDGVTPASSNTTTHANEDLFCKDASFTNIAVFYLANYLAHCATVKTMPGETALSSFASIVFALFFPTTGIMRAVSAIIRHARFTGKDELHQALRASALCMLVRSRYWKPEDGDVIHYCRTTTSQKKIASGKWKYEFSAASSEVSKLENGSNAEIQALVPVAGARTAANDPHLASTSHSEGLRSNTQTSADKGIPMSVWNPHWMAELLPVMGSTRIYPHSRKTHGTVIVPEGYRLTVVPSDAKLVSLTQPGRPNIKPARHYHDTVAISSSYSLPKAMIAIVQTVYAAVTLYRTRGRQIEIFGYAAFGLTVTPYIVMSVLNLVAQVATPDYEALYLVRSEIMDEAERRGGVFDGVVAKLVHEEILEPDPRSFSAVVYQGETKDSYEFVPLPNNTQAASGQGRRQSAGPREHLSEKFFPFRPNKYAGKEAAKAFHEWLYIPSCTPFRRERAVTDKTVYPPVDSRDYSSKAIAEDKADNGYGEAQTAGMTIPERKHRELCVIVLPLCISFVSIIINSILSRLSVGESTKAQRGWTMSWLITGIALAPLSPGLNKLFVDGLVDGRTTNRENGKGLGSTVFEVTIFLLTVVVLTGVLFAPAIGGLVVVGQMISRYGTCISLSA